MRILHLSAWDNFGGSGRSAYRIHDGLRRLGHRSRMLVGQKVSSDPDVAPIVANRLARAADRAVGRAFDALDLQYLGYFSSHLLKSRRWFLDSDLVQLYNTHGGWFNHTALAGISARKPVVWRLSDMWPVTGHCAYSYDCDRWKSGCGACPRLDEYPRLRRDTSAPLWRAKRNAYARSRLTVVAPSRWIERIAKQSPLLGRFPVHRIPNGLDTGLFSPVPKQEARKAFGLDPAKPVLMFAAASMRDPRKGAALLSEALSRLRASGSVPELTLIAAGTGGGRLETAGYELKLLGEIRDDRTLARAYSAADLFVLPTLADNLPNGVIESLACGTPAVSFDVGGVSDAVRHMETGWLAKAGDAAGLAEGIGSLLADGPLRARMGREARAVAEKEFGAELQARRFAELYRQILGEKP